MSRKYFIPVFALTTLMFVAAPFVIANAPYESTMLLVQKIFYFHVPSWFVMFSAIFISGIYSAIFLFRGDRKADQIAAAAAEIAIVFGLMGLVTGPLWGRKAWGVWWQWDAKLTMALLLEMIFLGYQLVRKYGGPGSDKMSAALAIFGMVNVPFVYYSVEIWRTVHPKTSVVPTLGPGMFGAFWFSVCSLLLTMRLRLERERAVLDELYLAEEP